MKNITRIVIFTAAFVGMGMSLPSCPGDKAMQQQIDMLQQSNTDMTRKLQNLDAELKATSGDVIGAKSLINQLAVEVITTLINPLCCHVSPFICRLWRSRDSILAATLRTLDHVRSSMV